MQSQLVMQRHCIDVSIHFAAGEQGLRIRSKTKKLFICGVIQGLDAHTIPGQKQVLASGIPDGKGKHPVEEFWTTFAPFVIGLENDLGVSFGEKFVPLLDQIRAQFPIVINRPIEHQNQPQRFIHHRLIGAL